MKNPFIEGSDCANQVRSTVLQMKTAFDSINVLRGILMPLLFEEAERPTGECRCVEDKVSDIHAAFYSVQTHLILTANAVDDLLNGIEDHEKSASAKAFDHEERTFSFTGTSFASDSKDPENQGVH